MRLSMFLAPLILAASLVPVFAAGASVEIPAYPAAKLVTQDLRGGASVFEYALPPGDKPAVVWAFFKSKMGLGAGWLYSVTCDTPWGLIRVCKPASEERTFGIAVAGTQLLIFNAPTEFGAESLYDWLQDVMLMVSPPVAVVDGEPISSREYYRRLGHVPTGPGNPEGGLAVLKDLITERIQAELAKKENVVPTPEQIEAAWRATVKIPEIARQFAEGGVTEAETREIIRVQQTQFNLATKGVTVTDKEIEDYYSQHRADEFTTPEHAVVAAIFAGNKEIADKAAQMLREGRDFGDVARELSNDRTSAEQGGRLRRPVVRGGEDVPPEVQAIVLGTPVGRWTDPIEAGGGEYIIFKVLDRKDAVTRPVDEVREHIRQKLMLEKGTKKNDLNLQMQEAWQAASIKVHLLRYQRALSGLLGK